jgi:hypothetical protein
LMAELQAKPLVLIIDDDSWIRTLVAELLASEGSRWWRRLTVYAA